MLNILKVLFKGIFTNVYYKHLSINCYSLGSLWVFLPSILIVLTCDHADSEVVSSSALRVPGRALDTVGGARQEVIKGHHGVTGVHLVA